MRRKKGCEFIGVKGVQTKNSIKVKAYELFAANGFRAVTMQDICEATGLSRGGLYRHYDSTKSVFEEIILDLAGSNENDFAGKIRQGIPARVILDELLGLIKEEMLDEARSLSLAIYEYSNCCDKDFFIQMNIRSYEKWKNLIQYGIETGDFQDADVDQVVDIILYSYQGVRMWSRIVSVKESVAENIVKTVRDLLIKQ